MKKCRLKGCSPARKVYGDLLHWLRCRVRDKRFTAGNTVTRCEPANDDVICTYGKFGLVERCNADRLKVCKADGKAVSLERAAEVTADRISRFSPPKSPLLYAKA